MTLLHTTGRLILASLFSLLLNGCGSPSPSASMASTPLDSAQIPRKSTQTRATEGEINQLLQLAQRSASPQQERLILQAAALLSQRGDANRARGLLNDLDPDQLDNEQFVQYTLTLSKLALDDGSFLHAQELLNTSRLNDLWLYIPRQEQALLHERRADVLAILGEAHASLEERVTLRPLLSSTEAQNRNQQAMWQTLMTMSEDELQAMSALTAGDNNQELQGWYALALITKQNPSDLEAQLAHVRQWQSSWPGHPGSSNLPQGLRMLQDMVANQPKRIALLLPQKGPLAKAADAVRDGFMAAYFEAKNTGVDVPEVLFLDSSAQDVMSAYHSAVQQGAELIIGPLDKDQVSRLSQEQHLPVPTLAVNYSNAPGETTSNLFQFGLAAEDEALQLAQRAWVDGHRNVMLLTSQESWATRTATTFREAWQAMGGKVISQNSLTTTGNYSSLIQSMMQLEDSQRRAKKINSWAGGNVQFEPRRRQDADMLLLIARPAEARQIKPTLAFHYAGDLPVYATHQVYEGTSNPNDLDLEGIRFTTLPWFFANDNPVKNSIQRSAQPSPSYEKLYALGADSFQLYPRLQQLLATPAARLHGLTGLLSMDPQGLVKREQVWAKISSGKARVLPRVVSPAELGG